MNVNDAASVCYLEQTCKFHDVGVNYMRQAHTHMILSVEYTFYAVYGGGSSSGIVVVIVL